MSENLILATAQGIVLCEKSDRDWKIIRARLEGSFITCLTVQGSVILAGTRQGVYRSSDLGNTWALEQWVEQGVAPERIVATRAINGVVDCSRPLCPYPQLAVYKGKGDTNDAANFECRAPAR